MTKEPGRECLTPHTCPKPAGQTWRGQRWDWSPREAPRTGKVKKFFMDFYFNFEIKPTVPVSGSSIPMEVRRIREGGRQASLGRLYYHYVFSYHHIMMIMIVMMIMAMIRSTCLIIWWQSSMMKKSKTFLIIKGTEGGFSPRERGEQGGMRLNQNLNFRNKFNK